MKLSDMALTADLVEVPEDEILFSKQYYSIGAVAEMFKANVSLLRFWEKEFDILKPRKNGKGDRLFRPEDIKNLKMIHHLLRQKKFTIDGAKEFIKKNKQAEENYAVIETLQKLKTFLNELKANL
jgi:DNA-binding transcriptional MerR regulator